MLGHHPAPTCLARDSANAPDDPVHHAGQLAGASPHTWEMGVEKASRMRPNRPSSVSSNTTTMMALAAVQLAGKKGLA